jgi:hypothetical protein
MFIFTSRIREYLCERVLIALGPPKSGINATLPRVMP